MRSIGLAAAAALLVGGCGSQSVSAADSAAAAPAPPAGPDTIPAAFHGVFDGSLEDCARPSDQRLTVSARELRFHESIGSVRKVGPGPSGAIRVEADYQGEGEHWRSTRLLLLSDGGARLTVSGDGTRLDRIRCAQGAP